MPFRGVEGLRVHYREAGQGPSVLCFHASSSHSGQFKALIASLEDRYHVRAPDFLGYGRSDPLPDDDASLAWDIALIHAFLDDHGPAHIIGHSLGAAAAFCAARGREDVLSLTLIEPVLFALLAEADDPTIEEPRAMFNDVNRAMAESNDVAATRDFMAFWSGPAAFDALDEATSGYVTATIGRVWRETRALGPDAPDAPRLADAEALTVPVHLLRGSDTRASASAIVDLLADAIPNATLTTIPGASHMAAATDPDRVNPHISAFLDAHRT